MNASVTSGHRKTVNLLIAAVIVAIFSAAPSVALGSGASPSQSVPLDSSSICPTGSAESAAKLAPVPLQANNAPLQANNAPLQASNAPLQASSTSASTESPTASPAPTATPAPTDKLAPTAKPAPIAKPRSTARPTPRPAPASTPQPAGSPSPTPLPTPDAIEAQSAAPSPAENPQPVAADSPAPLPTEAPPQPVADGALPSCKGVYEDLMTPRASYDDWAVTLLDTIYMVPSSYYPPDLVSTGLRGGGSVRSFVQPDLTLMAAAAAAAGAPLQVQSAFRSYATQGSTFNYWVSVAGRAAALLASARPGHSEHQLGTAIDFTSLSGTAPWNYADWATTKAGAWMLNNAWQYGFIQSYPKGKSPSVTCYQYEPWHYRYVGRAEAAAIHASGLTTRQYLWPLQ